MIVVTALVSAVAVVLVAGGVPAFRRIDISSRIEPYLSGLHGKPSELLRAPESRRGGRAARRLQSLSPATRRRLSERLAAAGESRDPGDFRFAQLLWAAGAAIGSWAVVAVMVLVGASVDPIIVPLLTAIALVSGWLARDWWLTKQIENRRASLSEELPTALDLMTLSIMSGESIPAAFARVAQALGSGVGAEFAAVVGDVRTGRPSIDALEAMKERVPVTGVARLVDALVTGIERGAPLADVLRAQADDGREARRRLLLEMGGRREVLMLVPVVFLIMPVVVVFTLLPGLVALDLLVP
jgi:tight adherence protein C